MSLQSWLTRAPGAQLIVSSVESGLWYDHDERTSQHQEGWGIAIKLRAGRVYRPFVKLSKLRKETKHLWNEWNPNDHSMVKFTMPVPILPFVSIALGKYGFYIGFKTFHAWQSKYHEKTDGTGFIERKWQKGLALTPSVTFRRTRHK